MRLVCTCSGEYLHDRSEHQLEDCLRVRFVPPQGKQSSRIDKASTSSPLLYYTSTYFDG